MLNHVHQLSDRLSSKRKLDDAGPSGDLDDAMSELVTLRTRMDVDTKAVGSASLHQPGVSNHIGSILTDCKLQFFVRQISDGNTLVLYGNPEDLVESVHQRIRSITGIPMLEQRLIYRGKQLQWDQSLAECEIQNDSALQLVGRMRSTHYPLAWQLIGDFISHVFRRCKGDLTWPLTAVKSKLLEFLEITFGSDTETASGHLEVFLSSAAPSALVMLYMSSRHGNKECAVELIRHFIISCRSVYSTTIHAMVAPILLEFCKLLPSNCRDNHLYSLCRSSLGCLISSVKIRWDSRLSSSNNNSIGLIQFVDIVPVFSVVAANLSEDLTMCVKDSITKHGPRLSDVRDFAAFSASLQSIVMNEVGSLYFPFNDDDGKNKTLCNYKEIKKFCDIYHELVEKTEACLSKMDQLLEAMGGKERRGQDFPHPSWSQYLTLLKVLNKMSSIFRGGDKQLWMRLRHRKISICFLITNYAKCTEDNSWILALKDVTNFESRRHLAMMMLPEARDDDFEEQYEMLIDRAELLVESYQYITHAYPTDLRIGLRMEFKNEEASGPGVLREWFVLVCQAIFNPANTLFMTSRSDRRRFYPNPASRKEALQLEYYKFAGRIVALALTHKVQVGILLDRVLYLQLAGLSVKLEDIRDTEPELYSSCKKILEMDADAVDSDVLGLTFVREVEEVDEELGRKVVELCAGGKGMSVNSRNRRQYVDLMIHHTFVTSMCMQVSQFSGGFGDIMRNSSEKHAFFKGLQLEDLDRMLHGEEKAVPIDDWKSHTGYNGYKKNDPQITWFWKIVEEMSTEKRKNLLFFWTSVRYLPMEGFCGLGSRLLICKSSTSDENHLPSSHTCFFRLCLPPYSSKNIMKERLRIITQEHVSGSFGIL